MSKPKRRPSDTKEARRERWHKWKERHAAEHNANRAHLLAAGFDGDPEAFVSQWRAGKIRVTFEVIKKGE